jgi:putative FmdB family regulatory protein
LPLYEYECERCGRFEVIQKFSDKHLKVCKKCGRPVQRLLSAPAIQFKGTGWYVTDYARKSGGEGEGKGEREGRGEGKGKGKGEGKEGKESGASTAGADSSSSKGDTANSETPKKAATGGSKKDR